MNANTVRKIRKLENAIENHPDASVRSRARRSVLQLRKVTNDEYRSSSPESSS